MEITTCEQYVLAMLGDAQRENEQLREYIVKQNQYIEELTAKLNEKKDKQVLNEECI